MNIKPFARQGHYTGIDNAILDQVMPDLSNTAWKVLCLIIRKTIGWNKHEDAIPYTQIQSGTGIKTNTTIRQALIELVDKGLITVTPTEKKWSAYLYALNRDYVISTENGLDASTENVLAISTENVPIKTKEQRTKGDDNPLQELVDYFADRAGKKVPRLDTKQTRTYWLDPLIYIYKHHGSDYAETKRAIYASVLYMQENGLTIATPKSIQNIATAGKADKTGDYVNGVLTVSMR